MKRSVRAVATLLVLVGTVTAFVYYFAHHPSVGEQLKRTPLATIGLILCLYFGTIGALALVNSSTLRLCRVKLGSLESLLLTAYTAVVNFFGPLQSGPAFRAIYLKKKHGLNLKNYTVATLVYYFFYGTFSGLLLLYGVLHWWLLPLVALGLAMAYATGRSHWLAPRLGQLDLRGWYYLALATFIQVGLTALIYYTELHSVAPGSSFSQALIYTGAANLALFVSITPGAIGFRESFLVFSQDLHHISNSAIVAASILDRSIYIVLLLILALFIFASHAGRRLKA